MCSQWHNLYFDRTPLIYFLYPKFPSMSQDPCSQAIIVRYLIYYYLPYTLFTFRRLLFIYRDLVTFLFYNSVVAKYRICNFGFHIVTVCNKLKDIFLAQVIFKIKLRVKLKL